ncbi:MAG TPA: universal stress protein [Acidimicrobiales bacterium]|nr:universal stress protein [Acidimicrobiales bacterium]
MERIVVGVDGSEGSVAALRWAVAEAALRGAVVEAVNAFHVPYVGAASVMPLMLDPKEFEASAQAALRKVVADVDASALAAPIVELVVEGPASMVLVEAGKRASMLVVGARGHGGLAGMLLGSVSRQVTEHATVPVVVVPKERT